jgi:citrate synthase
MREETKEITELILEAAKKARKETSSEPEPGFSQPITWPIQCTVGPGLEGAIACETKIGYVNGVKGWLIYRGYDIFELCAYSTFEEVSYLLLHGQIPNSRQLKGFKKKLFDYTHIPRRNEHNGRASFRNRTDAPAADIQRYRRCHSNRIGPNKFR